MEIMIFCRLALPVEVSDSTPVPVSLEQLDSCTGIRITRAANRERNVGQNQQHNVSTLHK